MSDYEEEFDSEVEAGLTSVLLGFSGKDAVQSDLSVLGNHIGGSPLWFQNVAPPSSFIKCEICGKQTDFLVQLSCPLPSKDYDRSLYIFACSDPNCRRKDGSVIAIRGIESNDMVKQRITEELNESQPQNQIVSPQGTVGDSLFGVSGGTNSNPFASPIQSTPQPAPQTKSKKKNKKKSQAVSGKYPCKLVEVEEEYLEAPDTNELLKGVKIEEMETEAEESKPSASDATDIKALEANSDPAFIHFIEIVECNPDQVLRYERGLKPLLYSSSDGVPEKLKNLKTHTLEVQLMPHLISVLETADMIADGMEWGTIFVATDVDDKLPELNADGVGYSKEFVAVQWE